MTGTSLTSRISCISSMPSVSGSIRSSSTSAGRSSSIRPSVSPGSPVTTGANPAWARASRT